MHLLNINGQLAATVLHEARHVWQRAELSRTDLGTDDDNDPDTPPNDDDGDLLAEVVTLPSAFRFTEATSGTGDSSPDPVSVLPREIGAEIFADARRFICQ